MIQYTVRGITEHLDSTLRHEAARAGKSLNAVVLDFLQKGVGISSEPVKYHDIDHLAGTWVQDPEFDRAIDEMDVIDEAMWR